MIGGPAGVERAELGVDGGALAEQLGASRGGVGLRAGGRREHDRAGGREKQRSHELIPVARECGRDRSDGIRR